MIIPPPILDPNFHSISDLYDQSSESDNLNSMGVVHQNDNGVDESYSFSISHRLIPRGGWPTSSLIQLHLYPVNRFRRLFSPSSSSISSFIYSFITASMVTGFVEQLPGALVRLVLFRQLRTLYCCGFSNPSIRHHPLNLSIQSTTTVNNLFLIHYPCLSRPTLAKSQSDPLNPLVS